MDSKNKVNKEGLMLTIKKRYPYNKFLTAGAFAFIAGYGAFMLVAGYLPQKYMYSQIGTSIPVGNEVKPETTSAPATESENVSAEASGPIQPAVTSQTMPNTQPTQTDTSGPSVDATPIEATPNEPTTPEDPEATSPDPDNDTIIDDLIDIVTP